MKFFCLFANKRKTEKKTVFCERSKFVVHKKLRGKKKIDFSHGEFRSENMVMKEEK